MNSYTAFLKKWNAGQHSFKTQTSGSTGKPKTILLQRNLLEHSAQQTLLFLPSKPSQTLICLPTTSIGGFMQYVRAAMWQTPVVQLCPSANPSLQNIDLSSPTTISLTPLQLYNMLQIQANKSLLKKLHSILLGGGPLNYKLPRWLLSNTFHTYGMTETYSHIAIKNPNKTYFKPLPGVQIKRTQNNCLCIKATVTKNQWLQTQDIAHMRGNNFKIIGRADQTINTGGVKLNIAKITTAFLELNPQLINQFFIGHKPHPVLGQQAVLYINKGIEIEQIKIPKPHFAYIKHYIQLPFEYTPTQKIKQTLLMQTQVKPLLL